MGIKLKTLANVLKHLNLFYFYYKHKTPKVMLSLFYIMYNNECFNPLKLYNT